MTKLSSIPRAEYVTLLLYGPTGSGKTHFAAGTVGSRAAIIDIGQGIATLKSPYFTRRFPNHDPEIISIDVKDDARRVNAFDDIRKQLDKLFPSPDFDTIVIDEVTALRRYATSKAVKINQDLNKSQTFAQSKGGVILPAVQDYGTEMKIIDWLVSQCIEAAGEYKKNFILVAHERRVYRKAERIGDTKTLTSVRPGFTGETFPDDICAYFDYVWHTEVKSGVFNLRTQPNAIITAKTRGAGVLQEMEKDPNFLNILERLRK